MLIKHTTAAYTAPICTYSYYLPKIPNVKHMGVLAI